MTAGIRRLATSSIGAVCSVRERKIFAEGVLTVVLAFIVVDDFFAFVGCRAKESDELKVWSDEGKSQRRGPGRRTLMSDSRLLGSMFLEYRSSKEEEEDVADGLILFGGTTDGPKRRRRGGGGGGESVVWVETVPESVPAMKIHFQRLWKDNQKNVTRASCAGRADDGDPASKRSGGATEMSDAASMPIFQILPREVLESICNLLPASDLCRLCQVRSLALIHLPVSVCSFHIFSRLLISCFQICGNSGTGQIYVDSE